MAMKEVNRIAAQGDVLFRRVDKVPSGFKKQKQAKRIVVAHSETGHHHAIDVAGVRHFVGEDPLVCYLQLESVEHADVVHHRAWDTHETVRLLGLGSTWEVRRQREGHSPEDWRRVAD